VFSVPALGQEFEFVHPELSWRTIETEHVLVHFHQGAERTAREVAKVAESIYEPVTALYQHEPDQKVSFVIRDHDDYSNGAAYFYDNKIEIWASALDFELRGTHPWIANVVTHEFTHLIQIQTAMKLGRTVPAIYFQWFGYEAARRPDILYGYPNVLVSYPLSAFVVPSWFAEGTAQYNHPELRYDYWDSHRDMILRMYMLEGTPLSWEEMSVFGKTSLGNESAYNAGFSIVQYIAETYGVDKLLDLSTALGAAGRLTMDGAVEKVFGIPGEKLYEDWKKAKALEYDQRARSVRESEVMGELIESEGFGNYYPQFSPDGNMLYYVSNKGRDYFSQSGVYSYDLRTQTASLVVPAVRSTLSLSPDGRTLYYAKTTHDNPHWSGLSDIFAFDLEEEEERRLTRGLRAHSPRISPDGTRLAFAHGSDGTLNLGLMDVEGGGVRPLTAFTEGEQIMTPAWSPDGELVAFGYSKGHSQSVGIIDTSALRMQTLPTEGDARTPAFSVDGKRVYYSNDAGGIFNIYSIDFESGRIHQVTNVLGGAFQPTISPQGGVAYAVYTVGGYKIALLDPDEQSLPRGETEDRIAASDLEELASGQFSDVSRSSASKVEGDGPFGATPSEEGLESRPYKYTFSSLTLIPLIRVDNYNPQNKGFEIVKPGLYFASGDMLNGLGLFGGAAMNVKLERDLFVIFDYRGKLPLLYGLGIEPAVSLEVYNVTRKALSTFELTPYFVTTEITYNLLEFDVAFRQKVFTKNLDLRLWYALSRYSADIGSFVNPNTGTVSPAFRNTYLVGHAFNLRLDYDGLLPSTEKAINPVGRELMLHFGLELNKFNGDGEYDIVEGQLVPVYDNLSFLKFEGRWAEHIQLPFRHHTLNIRARAATVLGDSVDSFFDYYAGGFVGMRGYPYYSIGGRAITTLSLSYRFPITRSINFRFLQFYFTKLYASVFADIGEAWRSVVPSISTWKKDVGVELRLEAFSFYAYPTRIFLSGAYGLDPIEQIVLTPDGPSAIRYGREWWFYLGILFDFELNDMIRARR
jgi:Tol biopolymer transport system component